MNGKTLLQEISDIEEDLISDAEEEKVRRHFMRKKQRVKRLTSIAAVFLVFTMMIPAGILAITLLSRAPIDTPESYDPENFPAINAIWRDEQEELRQDHPIPTVSWQGLRISTYLEEAFKEHGDDAVYALWIIADDTNLYHQIWKDLQANHYLTQDIAGKPIVFLSEKELEALRFDWKKECIWDLASKSDGSS